MISRAITSHKSSEPSAAKVPAAKSRESPGRNGVITSPVSQKTIRNRIRWVQVPYWEMTWLRCSSRCRKKSMA
jgi:hypothetical protein